MKTIREFMLSLKQLEGYSYFGRMVHVSDGKEAILPVFTNGETYIAMAIEPRSDEFKVILYEIEIDNKAFKATLN
jgi:hypothetical protein